MSNPIKTDYTHIYDNVKIVIPYDTGGNIIKDTTKDLLGGDTYINSVTYNPACERICGFRSKNTVWQDVIHSSTLEVLEINPSWVVTLKETHKLKPLGIKLYKLTKKEGATYEFNRDTYTLFEAVNNVVTIPVGFYLLNGIEIVYRNGIEFAYQWNGDELNIDKIDIIAANDVKLTDFSMKLPTIPSSCKIIDEAYNNTFKLQSYRSYTINHMILNTITNKDHTNTKPDHYKINKQEVYEKFGTANQLIPIFIKETNQMWFQNGELWGGINYRTESKLVVYDIDISNTEVTNVNIPGKRGKVYDSYSPNDSEVSLGWNTGYYDKIKSYLSFWFKVNNCTDNEDPWQKRLTLSMDLTYLTSYQIYSGQPDAIWQYLTQNGYKCKISDLINNNLLVIDNNKLWTEIIESNNTTSDYLYQYTYIGSDEWPHEKTDNSYYNVRYYISPQRWTRNKDFPDASANPLNSVPIHIRYNFLNRYRIINTVPQIEQPNPTILHSTNYYIQNDYKYEEDWSEEPGSIVSVNKHTYTTKIQAPAEVGIPASQLINQTELLLKQTRYEDYGVATQRNFYSNFQVTTIKDLTVNHIYMIVLWY